MVYIVRGDPRSEVELTEIVRCKHCEALHEDIGDFFGENLHKKHLCGSCGRDIFGKPSVPISFSSHGLSNSTWFS